MEDNKVEIQNFKWRSNVRCIAWLDLVQSSILIFVDLAFIVSILFDKDRSLLWALLLSGFITSVNLWSVISLLVDTTKGSDPISAFTKVILWRNINIILVIVTAIIGILTWQHLGYTLIGLGSFQLFFRACVLYIACEFIKELKGYGATQSVFPPDYHFSMGSRGETML